MSVKDFPQDCLELVFKFLGQGHDLESVSMVCKKFLSITNQVKFSLTLHDPVVQFLPRLLLRFLRLKVIDFSHFNGELEGLLHQISQSELDLDLVNLSNQRTLPVDGLRELGSKMINLRVLICSNIGCLRDSHLIVISYCFPFLEELDISFPLDSQASDFGLLRLSSMLENLRKIDFSGNHLITDKSLLSLCENCRSLEEISFFKCFRISQVGIASAIRMRPSLASISFNIEKKRIHGPGLTPSPINLDLIDSFVSLKRLTAIDLSNSFISDELLISIANVAVDFLKKLVLQDCWHALLLLSWHNNTSSESHVACMARTIPIYISCLVGWDYSQPPEEEKDSYKELLAIKRAIATKKIMDPDELSYKIVTMDTLLGYSNFHH
ncbi:hypothetical protein TSUD_67290 [Trifolium subterraneum]|uniref:F-box domain-containing protein n=1 Tax=Trifolium subterraneum TaxID=3900 RepID=A0A2Z6NSY8_TRISU|nr:hypothetical protein TSUD_67290 [Trifolium subterraneum]